MDHIPEGIAKPLWEVSEKLGIPPILGHTSIVLYNWRRLDVNGAVCMENLSTLNNFFDGRDESWFYLITVEIEARGAPGIVPVLLVNDAIQRFREEKQFSTSLSTSGKSLPLSTQSSDAPAEDDLDINAALVGELSAKRVSAYVAAQLRIVAEAIRGMCDSLTAMREGCHPFIFYHRVRPFLSGWKHNPTMPNGLLYEGVSDQRMQFYGGSAAQSALIPFLDISFGITHESNKSKEFLLAMRDYMLRPHREFLAYLEKVSCIRPFVLEQIAAAESLRANLSENASYLSAVEDLKEAYDLCVQYIQRFRTGHISLVSEYIMVQQKQHAQSQGLENTAGGKGTGGTDLMNFLKPIRDDCTNK
jgi:indoleamine 2,3-dioxygenase